MEVADNKRPHLQQVVAVYKWNKFSDTDNQNT